MPVAAVSPRHCTRTLREWSAASASGSPLKVDRQRGVIYGVKVQGLRSRNSHGVRSVNGTDYTRECLERALSLYEGVDVLENHDPKNANRSPADTFGKLKNVRLESDGIRADLHYLKSHPLADRVCEDVERGLGVYGLSHHAISDRDRIDRKAGRLVIENIVAVRSVDLVRNPATNKNLWESLTVPTTLRALIEGLTLTPARDKWRRRLLEDDDMAPAMDAPMPAEPAAGEEGDAAWQGFMQEIQACGEKFKAGEIDAKTAGKKIVAMLKAHESLFGADEPADEPADDSGGDDVDDDKKESDEDAKKNSYGSDDKQESQELRQLRAEKGVRTLCESLSFAPTELQVEALAGLPDDAKRRKLIESFKGAPVKPGQKPTSAAAPGQKPAAAGKVPATLKELREYSRN